MHKNTNDFYNVAVNKKINYEHIRKICRESDFKQVNLMNEQNGGYVSNLNITLDFSLKSWLGMADIFDNEIYLAYFVPYPFRFRTLSGGFAITKVGIFSNYLNSDMPYSNYVSFEDLAKATKIYENCPPTPHLMYLQLIDTYRLNHH